jgi:hypothetical protein
MRLEGDGDWRRLLTALRRKTWGDVVISGWSVEAVDEAAYGGDGDGTYKAVVQWLTRKHEGTGSDGQCPLN